MASELNNGSDQVISSINVTPFVDVVLVLLVIFMVTMPLIAKDILNLNLPKTESGDGNGVSSMGIAINKSRQILLNGVLISDDDLRSEVKKAVSLHRETQAIIAADVDVNYGSVAHVIDLVKSSGLSKFAIQVERENRQ